jgi:hypothetical protein
VYFPLFFLHFLLLHLLRLLKVPAYFSGSVIMKEKTKKAGTRRKSGVPSVFCTSLDVRLFPIVPFDADDV